MYKKCLICNNSCDSLFMNNLPMRRCNGCGLIWRERFDIPIAHYQEKEVNLSEEKIKDRMFNSLDRINLFGKYADMNNLCDIGTGEGIFLKALKDAGYKNAIGIEPSNRISKFAEENNLNIINGTINDIGAILANRNIHTITMFHLIEHLENPLDSLNIILAGLKPGGKLIVETPDIDAYSFKKTKYRHKLVYPEHLFYFNGKNLRKLLEKVGFKIVATGKRDFNQNNFSIKESLFRLGLFKKENYNLINDSASGPAYAPNPKRESSLNLFLKNIIRRILNKIVIISGRLDYIWIAAEKP